MKKSEFNAKMVDRIEKGIENWVRKNLNNIWAGKYYFQELSYE